MCFGETKNIMIRCVHNLTNILCLNLHKCHHSWSMHVCLSINATRSGNLCVKKGKEKVEIEKQTQTGLNTLISWAISQVAEWCWRLEAPEWKQAPPLLPLTFNPLTT